MSAEETLHGELVPDERNRPLPARRTLGELEPAEMATAALAAAGGIVAGAATVAAMRAARATVRRKPARRRQRKAEVVASRSVLIDIHLLGGK